MTIHYTKGEEWANTLSHGVGILIGIAGGGYLLLTAMKSGNPWATGGMWLYLFGMLSSYISSTWYHRQPNISSPRSVATNSIMLDLSAYRRQLFPHHADSLAGSRLLGMGEFLVSYGYAPSPGSFYVL